LALIGTNGAGVGTSSLAAYDKAVTALPKPPAAQAALDGLMDGLYEAMQDESAGFLDCEGSALFLAQSACNHSCVVRRVLLVAMRLRWCAHACRWIAER
jgi:hypothetical protein